MTTRDKCRRETWSVDARLGKLSRSCGVAKADGDHSAELCAEPYAAWHFDQAIGRIGQQQSEHDCEQDSKARIEYPNPVPFGRGWRGENADGESVKEVNRIAHIPESDQDRRGKEAGKWSVVSTH